MDGEIVDCTVVWYRMYFPNLFVVNSVIHLLVEIIILIGEYQQTRKHNKHLSVGNSPAFLDITHCCFQ